ncbi:MAG: hypothetical protein AAGA64_13045 [Bacteroidota bacterium]
MLKLLIKLALGHELLPSVVIGEAYPAITEGNVTSGFIKEITKGGRRTIFLLKDACNAVDEIIEATTFLFSSGRNRYEVRISRAAIYLIKAITYYTIQIKF